MLHILRFLKSEDGPTAVEYAVMLAMIVLACLASLSLLGEATAGSMQNAADALEP